MGIDIVLGIDIGIVYWYISYYQNIISYYLGKSKRFPWNLLFKTGFHQSSSNYSA